MKKILSLILVSSFFFTCSDDADVVDPGIAPEIPPVTTFLMDFDVLNASPDGRTLPSANWGRSAATILIWNVIITGTLAVPVASFAESFKHTPTFDTSLPGWVWEYDYDIGSASYHAKLQAQATLNSVDWNMFITRDGVYEDFNWYSGSSALNGLSGTWNLNANPNDPTEFLLIEWNRSLSGETADIKYTVITPGANTNGSFIFFEKNDAAEFDRQYDIFAKPENNTTEIEWDSVNKDGRIKDPIHYNDSEYHCWDETLEDIDCPT